MDVHPKVCPRCGEEYLHTVEVCAECGVALVARGEEPAPEAEPELGPSHELVRIRVEHPAWIETLAARLADQDIPSRVQLLETDAATPRRAMAPCALYVRPQDAERARAIDHELMRAQLPDLPDDVMPEWREAEACPACGTPLDPEAIECSECGLAFGQVED